MLTELKLCPFCGDRLEAWGVNYRHSTDSECVLAHIRVTPTDIDAWNRRVISASPDEGREALAWRVEWERGGKTWVRTYTNERDAIDDKQAFSGTVTPLYPLATAPTMIEEDAAIELLRKFMEYRDSDYVPNVLFDQARLIIDRAAAKGESE